MGDPADRPSLEEMAGGHARGIPCPHCLASAAWSVYYTRPVSGGIRRVRVCRRCGGRSVTLERLIGAPLASAEK